jgi:general secretion pathway protein H
MQYRAAVKDVVSVFSAARYQAINDGRAQDVLIDTRTNALRLNDVVKTLPSELRVGARAAGELNSAGLAVIRFYPEGGSSGGEVSVEIPQRYGVRVIVDWLIGGISQEKYAIN